MQQQRPRRVLSETTLGTSEAFTSDAINGEKYRRLTGKVFSDQGGSLEIQHADAVAGENTPSTWDTITTVAVTGGTATAFDEVLYCKFVRLVYTNGATAQNTFRISAYLSEGY